VVDGLVALGKYPIKLGVILVGTDTLAVDFAAAKIMGYNRPRNIGYLRLADELGIGNSSIEMIGADIDTIQKQFPAVNNSLFNLLWNLQLKGVKIYTKITGDIVPPILGDL
jgi:uncharacterized protein (DUF362 family)